LANIEGISMGKRETRTEPYYSIIYQYIFIIIQTWLNLYVKRYFKTEVLT